MVNPDTGKNSSWVALVLYVCIFCALCTLCLHSLDATSGWQKPHVGHHHLGESGEEVFLFVVSGLAAVEMVVIWLRNTRQPVGSIVFSPQLPPPK